MSCIRKKPKANLVATPQGEALWLNNASNYNDKGCKAHSRKARWVIFKNKTKVFDSAYVPLSTILPFGQNSTAQAAKLTNGVGDLFDYIEAQGYPLVDSDKVTVSLQVQNCHRARSGASIYQVVYESEECPDCCCDNENIIVYRTGGNDYCAETRQSNTNHCLIYAD
jgi:hypothetical protein